MASPDAVPEVANWILSLGVGAGTAIAAYISYLKKPKAPPGKDVAVTSAVLFSDKALIERLVNAIEKNNRLLEADAQRRHDEHIVREALAKHGISE